MNAVIKSTLQYNIFNDNDVMYQLNCLLIENYRKLDVIFYKIIIKYINPFYSHLFYKDLINICNKNIRYGKLADKICYIDKTVLSNDFRFINKFTKKHIVNKSRFNKYYKERDYNCLIYYDTKEMITFFSRFNNEFYTILLWLYEIYEDELIIKYILYLHISTLKTEYSFLEEGMNIIVEYNLEYKIKKKIKNNSVKTIIKPVDIDFDNRAKYYSKLKK